MQKLKKNLAVSYGAFASGDTDLAIKSLVTAFCHHANGQWSQAEKLRTYQFLAWLYFCERRLTKTLDCLWKVLYLQEQLFGAGSPQIASTAFNLAEVCRQLGLYEQAETLYGRTLPIAVHSLGSAHPCCEVISRRRQEMLGLRVKSDNRASSTLIHQSQR